MKTIKLRSLRHGNVHLNVSMIEAIYDHNGLTHVSTSKLIWEVKESVEEVNKMIYQPSEPIQDGMKTVYKDNAIVKKKIDDLTDMNNLNNLNLRSK
mgnify:CR=1 FL=1|tara:strand:+ start:258 stop:545 length:288 start_codon:yes stop_codon:yes gene_type:complete